VLDEARFAGERAAWDPGTWMPSEGNDSALWRVL
jgi:hypothetical protein